MEKKNKEWEELANKLGLNKELMAQMGIQNLSSEQIKILDKVVDLHSNDRQSVQEFIQEMGLKSVLNQLPDVNKNEINNQEQLNNLMQQIKEITSRKDLNL